MSWVMRKRITQIELFVKYPHDVQKDWLENLISTARCTEFGKKYQFDEINSYTTFKDRVPLSNYEDLSPYIQKLRKGEENILWPTKSKWFAKSAGTSGNKSKYIPVTQESLKDCHFKGGKDMLSLYCYNYPETQIFNGKSVIMGGSHEPSLSSNKKDGDLSAIIVDNLPFWVNIHQTPNKEIRLMNDFEKKIQQMALITSDEDVRTISGVPSWILVLLHKILELKGIKQISEVWPNLELYMHGGVNFNPYKNQFEKLLAKNINYLETYNASEGFFGIQDQKNSDEMLLMLDYGIFYEFIPIQEITKQKAIPLWEIELGKTYAMVISTNAGLWRYVIGDTVVFTCLSPYRIKINGRVSQFINAVGEELTIDNSEKAIQIACEKNHANVNEYTAGPKYMTNSNLAAHEWVFEFNNKPEDIDKFTETLDESLKKLNSDYAAKRKKNLALQKPIVHIVPYGFFYKWMEYQGKLGRQFKVPRLSNNRKNLDSILKLMKKL